MQEPIIEFTDIQKNPIASIPIGNIEVSTASGDFIVLLWNGKDRTDCRTARRVRLTCALKITTDKGDYLGGTFADGQEILNRRMVQVKSSGTVGEGIEDDNMLYYKAIGGDPTIPDNILLLKDIPTNCARRLHIRLAVPPDARTTGSISVNFRVLYI